MRIKSSHLRAMMRLLGECRELGDDAIVWRQHFYAAVGKLIGADVMMGGEVTGCLRGQLRWPGGTACGLDHEFDLEGYRRLGQIFAKDCFQSQLWAADVAAVRHNPEQGGAVLRQQVFTEREWLRSFDYERVARVMGADAVMQSLQPIDVSRDAFEGLAACRAPGRPLFDEGELRLLRLLNREVARLVGGPLARFSEPAPTQLPPRARQVLRCLLEGDADKAIASRLGLSPHTVNHYTKQIYHHFGVGGRTELLSRWVRRGWGSKSPWEEAVAAPKTGGAV